ncbi:MAG: biotin carboxyl carrier protein [Dehalococcoidia bacterium]|nr:biotin carboxyl carrier protein [Dehalococcoidia bacterium]
MYSNNEIDFVDVTTRDGNQSLWDATGIRTGMILSIAPVMDKVGFRAIDFASSINMGVSVRWHKEDPWERIRLCAEAMPNTILSFGTTGRRFIGFRRMPDSIQALVLKTVKACGIRRVWILDAAHDIDILFRTARMAKESGIDEVMIALSYSISPVHTDEFYAQKAREVASSPDVDLVYLKDQGGLLTIDRVRTLVPVIQQNINGLPLEIHSHCSTGLAPLCYLEAMKLGVKTFHVAVPPLAYGSSLPSALNILHNARHLGYAVKADEEALQAMSAHFQMIAEKEHRPPGIPVEHDVYYYKHQVPGGMLSTLKRQLAEVKMEHRLEEVLEEMLRVRQELGYPIMVTPFSQFVGTQATMNIMSGERYKQVPDGVLQYVAGWFGKPNTPIDPGVLDKITSLPRSKEFIGKELAQPTVAEIRQQMGIDPEVSDGEFLLRYSMSDREVDEMLAAGPMKTTYP